MITEKEIIKEFKKSALIVRRFKDLAGQFRTHYEFSIINMEKFAKVIIDKIKEGENVRTK